MAPRPPDHDIGSSDIGSSDHRMIPTIGPPDHMDHTPDHSTIGASDYSIGSADYWEEVDLEKHMIDHEPLNLQQKRPETQNYSSTNLDVRQRLKNKIDLAVFFVDKQPAWNEKKQFVCEPKND